MMYKALLKVDNKKAKLKLSNNKFLIAHVKVIDENTIHLRTKFDDYYIHPSGVRFVQEYRE